MSDTGESIRRGIEQDKRDLARLATDMADAVTKGAEALRMAVEEAKRRVDAKN